MTDSLNILVLGAAYGLLPATRLGLAGHRVTVVCRETERRALAGQGAAVELRRRDGKAGPILRLPAAQGRAARPGTLGLVGPEIAPDGFDMVLLAMGEPQFADAGIAALAEAVADAELPVVTLMNLLPPCFLRRLARFDVGALRPVYAAWDVWQRFDPDRVTAASPDAQGVRLSPDRLHQLTVTLASNFKVAPFGLAADQALLEAVAQSVARPGPDGAFAPARIVAHGSLAIPLSKWPMLIAGNCRCLNADGSIVPISAAVRDNPEASLRIYEAVTQVILAAGASKDDVVPFASYAAAARQLTLPSSLARALASGARAVERIDLMVLLTARALGLPAAQIAQVSATIQKQIDRNGRACLGRPG